LGQQDEAENLGGVDAGCILELPHRLAQTFDDGLALIGYAFALQAL
jgi:hypothetical protein